MTHDNLLYELSKKFALRIIKLYSYLINENHELINQDAFENWIIKVELSDKSDLDNLMDAKAYEAFCNK